MGGKFLQGLYVLPVGTYKDWKSTSVSQWVNNNGGHSQNKITDQTTHLVVHEKAWENKAIQVQEALELNKSGGRDIKIVTYAWLDDCFNSRKRKAEGPYLWERVDKAAVEQKRRDERVKQKAEKEKYDHASLMKDVFDDSTQYFLSEREKKEIEAVRAAEMLKKERLKEQELRDKRERKQEEIREQARMFGKGAKKARNEIFSENHHIYMDDTGFKYEVLLTKVDTRKNRNERYALTIYESNSSPPTYAMNSHFAGTNLTPSNNVLAAIGANFATAFKAFRKAFKERVGYEWEEREAHSKREKRGATVGSERGVAVSESAVKKAGEEVDFEKRMFVYHAPAYGSKGRLPPGQREAVAEAEKTNERVEDWIDGGDGIIGADTDLNQAGGENGSSEAFAMSGGLGTGVENTELFDFRHDPELNVDVDSTFPFDNNATYLAPDDTTANADPDAVYDFDAPLTGVTEPLEPGIQSMSETQADQTQAAERAQADLLEFMELPPPNVETAADMAAQEPQKEKPRLMNQTLNLGTSLLGKRKGSPLQDPDINIPAEKKRKDHDDVVANETSGDVFDKEPDYFFGGEEERQKGTGGGEEIPRSMLDGEDATGSEQAQLGEMVGMEDDGVAEAE